MIGMDILKPVVALLGWTMLMWVWMYATRIPAINKLPKEGGPDADVGWTGAKLDGLIAPNIQWKAHNYNHLHEAPTLFYAIAITLALMGMGDGINYWLAWGYVGFRIVHSIVQATVNIVAYRFTLFALATACLIGLTVHAGLKILHDCGVI